MNAEPATGAVVTRRSVLALVALTGTLARATPVQDQDDDGVSVRDHGADPSGRSSSVAAFAAALAAGRRVVGTPGDTYLIDAPVVVPAGRALVGRGAAIRLGPSVVGFRLEGDGCVVSDWAIQGNGGLYAVLNTGRGNRFDRNVCTGDIGHFFFSTHAHGVGATGNRVLGLGAKREITTAIVAEACTDVTVSGNRFEQILVGWGVQVRGGTRDFTIADNQFLQTRWSDRRTATAGQRAFAFTLGSACPLKKVQIDGRPVSVGYTIKGAGPTYTVLFDVGRRAGEVVALVGYRGAENIQINTGSRDGMITGNTIDGTGDSGIVCFGSHLTVTHNTVRNCGYAGIAIYGGQDHIVVSDNLVADCAQMDDGLSSPDDPRLASVFAGGILVSGEDATITGNTIVNTSGTMRYAVRVNKADMPLRTDGSATITIARNTYRGAFADGRVFAPNQTSGARINSIAVDGPLVAYPGRIDLDQPWTNAPPGDPHMRTSGFGEVWAVRDTATRREGTASLRTVAGEYVDFLLRDAAVLRNCNVAVSFWAKAASGASYVSVFTELEGLLYPLTCEITDPAWREYVIRFPLTANLADTILIRCGAMRGSANIQRIAIEGRRL